MARPCVTYGQLPNCPHDAPVRDCHAKRSRQIKFRALSAAQRHNNTDEERLIGDSSVSEYIKKLARTKQDNCDLRLSNLNLQGKMKQLNSGYDICSSSNSRPVAMLKAENMQLRSSVERKSVLLTEGSKALKNLKFDIETAIQEKHQMCNALRQQDCQIQRLTKENAELCIAACHTEKELHCIKTQFTANQASSLELKAKLSRCNCDAAFLKSQICDCTESLQRMATHNSQLESEINKLRSDARNNVEISNQLAEAQVKNRELSEGLDKSQKETQALRDEKQKLQGDHDSAVRFSHTELDKAQVKNRELSELLDKSHQEIQALRDEIQRLKGNHDSAVRFAQSELDKAQARIRELSELLDKSQKEIQALRDEIQRLKGNHDSAARFAQSELDQAQARIRELSELLNKSQQEIQALRDEIQRLKGNHDSSVRFVQSELDQAKVKNRELSELLDKSQKESQAFRDESQRLKIDHDRETRFAQSELDQAHTQVRDLSDRLNKSQQEMQTIRDESQRLKRDQDSATRFAQSEVDQAHTQVRDLSDRLNKSQQEMQVLRNESQRLREDKESAWRAAQSELDAMKQENRSLLQQLDAIPRLRRDVELLEKEDVAMRAELKEEQTRKEQMQLNYEAKVVQLLSRIRELEMRPAPPPMPTEEEGIQTSSEEDQDVELLVSNLVIKVEKARESMARKSSFLTTRELQELLNMFVQNMRDIQSDINIIGENSTLDGKLKRQTIVKSIQQVVDIFSSLMATIKQKVAENPNSRDAATFQRLISELDLILNAMVIMVGDESRKLA